MIFFEIQIVAEKEAAIQKALQYRFSSFDVDKILASKEKFSKHPHNYAMTKTKLLKEKGQVCWKTRFPITLLCRRRTRVTQS